LLEQCARQVLKHADTVDNWANNRIHGSLIGASFETPGADFFNRRLVKMLTAAGYQDVLASMPEAQRNTFSPGLGSGPGISDFLFAHPGACSGNPRILAAPNFSKYPLLCDLDLNPALFASAAKPKPPSTTPPPVVASPVPQPTAVRAEPIATPGEPAKPAVQAANLPPAAQTPAVKPGPPPAKPPSRTTRGYAWISGAIGCLFAAIVFGAVLARRVMIKRFSRGMKLMRTEGSPYVVVVPRSVSGATDQPLSELVDSRGQVEWPGAHQTRSQAQREYGLSQPDTATDLLRAGLLGQFSQWLKDRFVRKILSDRADLMQTQEAAALKALAVHERLSRVEDQIQQQNDSYQARIAELSAELLTAREENRELISERIRQIRTEMEAARMKALANARNAEEIG
jgi:hypothetical protein